MKKLDDVCVVVQARLGSQRVPGKMIRPFANTTLMDIVFEKIQGSQIIPQQNFYASLYEEELKEVADKWGVNIFHRSSTSANSEGTPLTEMYEWWDKLPYKYCILINACNPFLKIETIDEFVHAYLQTDAEGLFGVMHKKNYFWDPNGKLITPWPEGSACMNTKFVEPTLEAAHCLYAGRMDRIGDGIWMGDFQKPGDIKLHNVTEFESLDIDYEWQFNMCESIFLQMGDK